jgi:3-carboxy-cis,cis-muconate cycloisomerase
MSEALFDASLVPAELAQATGERAWVEAMLEVEVALAVTQAELGLVPSSAAEAIASAANAVQLDPAMLGEEAALTGTPAEPLVRALRTAVGDEETADWVHYGATSQDVVDSAAMLIARRALTQIEPTLAATSGRCAELAERHRATPMLARTLLQPALPTTFGLVAARWLVGVDDARERLRNVAAQRLTVQLGGAAGTLAAFGKDGPAVAAALARRLGLAEPVLPWHTLRGPIHALAGALDETAGALGKVALDVVLLCQAEVGEVSESVEGGRGGSSSLAHKHNPVGSVLALAGARRVHAAAALLTGTMLQEHERSATGAWHSEWSPLSDALALTGGVAATMADVLAGLTVHPERMRENLEESGVADLAISGDPAANLAASAALIDRALEHHQ